MAWSGAQSPQTRGAGAFSPFLELYELERTLFLRFSQRSRRGFAQLPLTGVLL